MAEKPIADYDRGNFHAFFERYKSICLESRLSKFTSSDEAILKHTIIHEIESNKPSVSFFHGTHSGHTDSIVSKNVLQPLYLSVFPTHSTIMAMYRAHGENTIRRMHGIPQKVSPVLFEIRLHLYKLTHEFYFPSLDVRLKSDYGIGIAYDFEKKVYGMEEIQLHSQKAQERLQSGSVSMVANGEDVFSMLYWYKTNIEPFDLDFLLPKNS